MKIFPVFNAVFFYALLFLLSGTTYANDSNIAIVRDRYGGSIQYDTRFDPSGRVNYYQPRGDTEGIRPYYYRDQGSYPYGNQGGYPYGNQGGYPYDRTGRPIPQYNTPPAAPYGGYGYGGYYPPNADVDPDETLFRELYQRNQQTLGQ